MTHKINTKRNSRSQHARNLWYSVAPDDIFFAEGFIFGDDVGHDHVRGEE
ncbi:MAG: hypothetical protein ABR911_06235 [Syntrophales bacterium]